MIRRAAAVQSLRRRFRDALAIPASEEVLEKHCHHYGRLYLRRGGDFEIIHQHIGDADFFPFGIGRGVNRHLTRRDCKDRTGEPFVVTQKEEASDTAERFKTYIQSPVLTDIQVKFFKTNQFPTSC